MHHELFKKFEPWQGLADAGVQVDFLGIKTRTEFFSMMASPEYNDVRFVQTTYPSFDEEYFEWIDLLEALEGAKDSFTMIELGAGFGRWLCRAGVALRKVNPKLPYRLIGVEAEPTHFSWMIEHLRDNEIDLTRCQLLNCAISGKNNEV